MRLTNPLWYLAAFLLALGSVMAAAAIAASAFDPLREATVVSANERVDAGGGSLAVFTDVLQPDRDISCRARGLDKRLVDIPAKGVDITTQSDGTTWHLIALLEDGRDGLKVACTPKDDRTDNASYAHAVLTDYTSTIQNGKGTAILGVTVGAALAAYVYHCRRRARRDAVVEPLTTTSG